MVLLQEKYLQRDLTAGDVPLLTYTEAQDVAKARWVLAVKYGDEAVSHRLNHQCDIYQLEHRLLCRGLALAVRELGPFYRITCRDGVCAPDTDAGGVCSLHVSLRAHRSSSAGEMCVCTGAGNDAGPIVGVSSGFTAGPLGLAHCDSLQVFTSR